MEVLLLAVGRMKAGPERDLLDRYVERARAMARALGITGVALREIEESRAREAMNRKRAEGRELLAVLRPGTALLTLDETGQSITSAGFAAALDAARTAGGPAFALVIGGPDGLDEAVRRKADRIVAYGRSTFPHQIVRVLAAEQIYRAMTILAGHPYHRP